MDIATSIAPGQRYIVWSASITYNSIVRNVGEEFVGVSGVTTYTGSGYASEIIEMQASALEAVTEVGNVIFPEQLAVNAAALEIVQPVNGTIYPEQLTINGAALEVGGVVVAEVVMIDC